MFIVYSLVKVSKDKEIKRQKDIICIQRGFVP